MSTSTQSRRYSRGAPNPTFESYDLAHSTRSRELYCNDDDIFDTLFPQPPPRSRLQAERLSRPSLPSLKASLQVDSADSSRSTSQLHSFYNSIESINSLSSYPSSTSSLSLLQSVHPFKQASTDSSIDYYSPAVSEVNSAETDHSVSSGHARSQSSEVDAHDRCGPLTPLTPNGASHAWRPKELNLVRQRQATASMESSLPAYQPTSSCNPASTISGDRNALLIGLGLGGIDLTSAPPAPPVPTSLPAEKLTQSKQGSAFLRSKSPQLGTATNFSRDGQAHTPTGAPQGPKQLILVSSGGPPALRRFPSRRPSEALHEAFAAPPPPSGPEASSRCTTPQMRSMIPVMPSGPAFVATRAQSPEVSSLAHADQQIGLSAQEFLAQIASTPEYQASQYLESTALSPASPASPSGFDSITADFAVPHHDFQRPLHSAASNVAAHHGDDRMVIDKHRTTNSVQTGSSPNAASSFSVLAAKAPGFSSTQRSRAASVSRRKAAPAPLVLTSSPATSNSDTLPGSAGTRRRRSLTATTIKQRSPLSGSHSSRSSTGVPYPQHTPTSAASGSASRQRGSASDYSEPLRTAFYDFDTEQDADEADARSKPRSRSEDSSSEAVPYSASTSGSNQTGSRCASLAQPVRNAIMDRIISESPELQYSAVSSRVSSNMRAGQSRESSSSDPATAFEFADLETGSSSEGLSLHTMMGFLQREQSRKPSYSRQIDDIGSELDGQDQGVRTAESRITQESESMKHAEAGLPLTSASPTAKQEKPSGATLAASAAPEVPTFNISFFAPSQASEAKTRIPAESKKKVEDGESTVVLASPREGVVRSRKQSMVPAPPSFAIRDASRDDQEAEASSKLLPSITDGLELRPAIARAQNDETPAGNSRWSSGSESDGESAMSIKAGRRSFSKGRKSFSTSRKNSIAIARELISGSTSTKEAASEVGRRQSKRSSKTRLSAQGAASQTLPVSSKSSSTSMSKRLLLNGLPSFRKKSFSNMSGQSASPSTQTCARTPMSAGPAFLDCTEFPFPPSVSPQLTRSPPVPGMTSCPLDREEAGVLTIKTAFASTFASVSETPAQSSRMPVSVPHATSSKAPLGPITTQQILAQARNKVWPENYIGTSVSAAGMSSPYLSSADDTFNLSFAPSRLAPTPPFSATRGDWASAPQTLPMPQSPRIPSEALKEKSLPSTPLEGSFAMIRSRSRTAEIAPPPKNLRHIRQSSLKTNLDKVRRDLSTDVFKSGQTEGAPFPNEPETAPASLRQGLSGADEEKLPTIVEAVTGSVVLKTPEPLNAEDLPILIPVLVDRKQAKWKKAQRIRKQQDRFPRRNSWSEHGLQWVAEQGADAFDRLAAEALPSSMILAAAGAPSGKSSHMVAGGSGGDGSSDGSDTDDYGSSDGGGGGGGGFGGAGGGGGGKQPGRGRNDADDSDDERHEASDEGDESEAMTDQDSDDDYGKVERSAATRSARGGKVPVVPNRSASMATSKTEAEDATNSDSSDDRPLGMLVDDPKALQKALRAQERKRHFDLAAQALEGKGNSGATSSAGGHARHAKQSQAQGQTGDAVLNPNDLTHRLAKVQGRRERANAPNAVVMQRSQTVARQDVGRTSERKQQADSAVVSRSKSMRTAPAERYAHPGMRSRTPSEAALRAKAMAQAMPHGPSPISPTLPNVVKMPDLPSNAMVTVIAAQKAMAHAQANPTPAAVAQAQALATSATAALNAATAQVKRGGSSPISPSFNLCEPVGHVATSPRMADGVEFSGARHRADSRGHCFPIASSGGANVAANAVTPVHQPGMFQRLRSRSISRKQAPLTINTAAAPPMPDLPRPSTASKDSQASSSPHSSHATTFAALSQAAMHHGRPSLDVAVAHADSQMQRAPSNHTGAMTSSHGSNVSPSVALAEPRQPHKVFILSRQRFTVVEVPVSARARDLALEVIERERLPMDDSKGGWVVFDCSAQLGIERPLREYEMITEVVNVRAHPKTDFFLIKRTELSPYLSIRSVPLSSPALAGYVYVQDRKKKWNKRWLELRDHGLYHAKNEKGKDETSICQISTFDVYLVDSSAVKMPKANGFALRSQDPITMFEKPDQDYVHYFCLTDPAAHRDWVRAILNARTYILRQEKSVLFQIDSPPSSQDAGVGAGASGGLSRKNTSRRPNGRSAAGAGEVGSSGAAGPSPPTPLIDSNAFAGPFAKGSLLADKAINDAKEALRSHAGVAAPTGAFNDLSLLDRNAVRLNEARRREEAIERQRRMKADGQPLIDFARK